MAVNSSAPQILVYDRGMPVSVNVQTVHPASWPRCGGRSRRAPLALGGGDLPWARSGGSFAASRSCGLTATTFFPTTTLTQPGAPILCDFGVEVTRTFETAGEVYATETPRGRAAVAVHRGPYNRMNEAHDAIRKWMAANRRESAGHSWDLYEDPEPDPADTETTVVYLSKVAFALRASGLRLVHWP